MSARAGKVQELWNNRITGYADVPPGELLENPQNFRRHPKEQEAALIGVLREVGFVDPVLVQSGSNLILDGHLRVELALKQGQATIPVKYVNLSDDEAQIVLATFDPLSAMARHDESSLEALLAQVKVEDVALSAMLANLREQDSSKHVEFDTSPQMGSLEYRIILDCANEREQANLLSRFEKEGLKCRALIS